MLSKAQVHVLEALAAGDCAVPGGNGKMLLRTPIGVHYMNIPTTTFEALRRHGWIVSVQMPNARPEFSINHAGRAELAISQGWNRVQWPCGECNKMQSISVKTYREINPERGMAGICCFQCAAKAFVAGDEARRAEQAQQQREGTGT